MLQLSLPSLGTLVFFSSIAELSAEIPAIPARERIVPVNTVFIDGSCFYFPSKRLRLLVTSQTWWTLRLT